MFLHVGPLVTFTAWVKNPLCLCGGHPASVDHAFPSVLLRQSFEDMRDCRWRSLCELMSTWNFICLNFAPLYRVTTDFPCVSAPHGLLRQLFRGHCRLGSAKCVHSGGATCLLVSLDGGFEANPGLCAMITGALVLPDLMMFSMAVPSLMVGLPCFLAALMRVTGLVDVSLNVLPFFMAIFVTVAFLKVVLSGW